MRFAIISEKSDICNQSINEFVIDSAKQSQSSVIVCTAVSESLKVIETFETTLKTLGLSYVVNKKNTTITISDGRVLKFYSVLQCINGCLRGQKIDVVHFYNVVFKNDDWISAIVSMLIPYGTGLYNYINDTETKSDIFKKVFIEDSEFVLHLNENGDLINSFQNVDTLKDKLEKKLDEVATDMIEANREDAQTISETIRKEERAKTIIGKIIAWFVKLFK